MARFMCATLKEGYFCAFKCASCRSDVTVTTAQLTREYRVPFGLFGPDQATAAQKAGDGVRAAMAKALSQLTTAVNVNHDFHRLYAPCQCKVCGTRQPWAVPRALRVLVCLIGVFFGLLIGGLLITSLGGIPFFLCPIALGVGGWQLVNLLHNLIARRRLAATEDPHCFPLVISGEIPRYVHKDDPRLAAILTEFDQNHSR